MSKVILRWVKPSIGSCAVLAYCGLLTIAPRLNAQPKADEPATTMSVKVNVVNVLASVRDKKGNVVSDLSKNDFSLSEDGRPQDIRYFTKESNLPLTMGLLVDTSLSQRRVLDQERTASHSFLVRMVREDKDKAFVIHFDREVELLQDLTSSHQKLEKALDSLQTPSYRDAQSTQPNNGPYPRGGGGGGGYPGGGYPGGGYPGGGRRGPGGPGQARPAGTLLYDAVFLASDELMKKQPGRKALIILSDGVDQGSKETLEYAMETAQRADTIIYSILFKDDEAYGNRGGYGGPGMGGPWGRGGMGGPGRRYPRPESHVDGKKVLERISKETGGRLFEVSKKHTVENIYADIEQELRNQYNLGYTPARGGEMAGGYHKIQLTTKKKDLVVQAREGYYGDAGTGAARSDLSGSQQAVEKDQQHK